jgi:RNA-directed DNA polymerase
MMSLVELVLALKPLLQSPDAQFKAIVRLLDTHVGLAEFEVARFMVTDALRGPIEANLKSADAEERAEAVTSVGLLYARAPAAAILRRAIKDPDKGVRAAATRAVKRLRLTDVAPPDVRFEPRQTRTPWNRGGWNPSGWAFGLAPGAHRRRGGAKSTSTPVLPVLKTRAEVAALVGVPPEELPKFMRAGVGPGSGYVEFERPKRRGGMRRIAAPRAPLRKVQRALLDKVLALVPTHEAAHGFVRARSIVTNAKVHVGAAVVVKIDLENFFPTIHFRRVQGLFESLGYKRIVAATRSHPTRAAADTW